MKFTPLFDEHGHPCPTQLVEVAGAVNMTHAHEADSRERSHGASDGVTPHTVRQHDEDDAVTQQLNLLARQVARLKAERRDKHAPTATERRAQPADGEATEAAGSSESEQASEGELSSEDDMESDNEHHADGGADRVDPGPLQSSALPPGSAPSGDLESATRSTGAMVHYIDGNGEPVCVYRAILPNEGRPADDGPTVASEIARLHSTGRWLILMLHGGHFAGAIMHNGRVTHHKCFHRYVVRAKRGTVQSVQDGKSATKQPKSAGASIRRHNETALKDDITSLLQSWAREISRCDIIFLQAPITTRRWFFTGKGAVLSASDNRIRRMPFPTKRPTLKEVLRVFAKLSAVYQDPSGSTVKDGALAGENDNKSASMEDDSTHHNDTQRDSTPHASHDATHVPTVAVDYVDAPLYTALNDKDLAGARQILKTLAPDDVNYAWNAGGESALHAAARLSGEAVTLLLEQGADPTVVNERNQVPFSVSVDKEARNAFRRYMAAEPDRWDYVKAQVPSPLTAEMEAKQEAKAKADKKRARERKKKADKAKAEALRKAAAEEERLAAQRAVEAEEKRRQAEQKKREKAMTPRQRAAAAALARHEAATKPIALDPSGKTCDFCGSPMPAKGGFEKLTYVYCQPQCMREHKPET
eukprot:m.184273 g.184273  ORF g.184273 m.184273 type:complete len:645 (-) comp16091_c0_seq1:727-2661(-)